MKLIIQIPCLNEERNLPDTLDALPSSIPGIDEIELLIIDDASSDRTVEVARCHGVHHVVRFMGHQGLARAFAAGLDASIKLGADIIVNTDGDNQYRGADVAALIQPILDGKADMVIGARDIQHIDDFSALKKLFQSAGSAIIRTVSGTAVPDTTSGFRAYTRRAAMKMNVLSDFTYTIETIIQAGIAGMAIASVPVRTNKKSRDSRLASSMGSYIARSIVTLIRIYTMYKPLKVFAGVGGMIFGVGALGVLRFLYFYVTLPHVQTGHVQSLIISAVFLMIGFQVFLFGMIADVTARNRQIMEDVLLRVKTLELDRRCNETTMP